jgi:hypothetical protein
LFHNISMAYAGLDEEPYGLVTLTPDINKWSVSCTNCFNPRIKKPDARWTEGCVDHSAGLDTLGQTKIFDLAKFQRQNKIFNILSWCYISQLLQRH